jgi:ureidoacrylate peracid hydrolase
MAVISRLNRRLDASHTALVLFDTLHGYLHPKDEAKAKFLQEHKILENMQRLLQAARKHGLITFYAIGAHDRDGADWVARLTDTDMNLKPIGDRAPINAAIHMGTAEFEIAAEIAPGPRDVVVPKHRWSAFLHTDLDFQLGVRGLDTIILAGGSTDVGVASTAFAARDLDVGLVLARDACYSMRGPNHDFFMDRVFPRMGRVMDVDDAIRLMESRSDSRAPTDHA